MNKFHKISDKKYCAFRFLNEYVTLPRAEDINGASSESEYKWSLSGVDKEPGTKYQVASTDASSYVIQFELKAVAIKYTVTLKGNANTGTWPEIANVKFPVTGAPVDTSIVVTYGASYPTIPEPTATGYTFKNWYDNTREDHGVDGKPGHFPDGV